MDVTQLLQYASEFVGAASFIAAVVPGAQGASVALGVARKGLDILAMNWGHAANAKPVTIGPVQRIG